MQITPDCLEQVSVLIENTLPMTNAPGVAIGLIDRDGLFRTFHLGVSDLTTQAPVTENTLFQIGSISKAFASIALLQLAERGELKLEDPLSKFLDWFSLKSDFEPIRIVDLMSHTAGIISGVDQSLSAVIEVYNLRQTQASTPPGLRFHYSNVGFKALGLVLEKLVEDPIQQILDQMVLRPLGMSQSAAAFTNMDRGGIATGYIPFFDDRPCPASGKLAAAPWFENNGADGSILSNVTDMAKYATALLNEMAPLLNKASYQELIRPRVSTMDGSHGQYYGLGLFLEEVNGHQIIGHSGGMVGYSSDLLIDTTMGLGIIVLTNGDCDPSIFTRGILALINGWQNPELPVQKAAKKFQEYAGVYYSQSGELLELRFEGKSGMVYFEHKPLPVKALEEDRFLIEKIDPIHPLKLTTDAIGSKVLEWGTRYYSEKQQTEPPAKNPHPEICGHFRSYNPWLSNFRVIARNGSLWMAFPSGTEEYLTEIKKNTYRVGPEGSPEKLFFGTFIGMVSQSAWFGGQEYNRVFTP